MPAAGVEQETLLKKLGLNPDAPGLLRLLEWGTVQRSEDAFRQVGDASIRMARLALEGEALDEALSVCTDKQKAVVRLLRDVGCASVKELCYFASVTTAVVAALVKKGVVEYYRKRGAPFALQAGGRAAGHRLRRPERRAAGGV